MEMTVLDQHAPDTDRRRQRAKERLYVLCQAGGWSFFLLLQLVFVRLFSKEVELVHVAGVVQTMALGVLITHYARGYLTRWGWKELGWKRLVPRILIFGMLLSVIWSIVGYGIFYGLLRSEWPPKIHPAALVFSSWINGSIILVGWLCIYFFYQLFDRFNRLDIERLRLTATVKEAELRALKSQVNPHFIFNALNSLRALIDEDPARARQAVTQLANLLRYSLQSGQLETVPFEDELRIVNDYLALEQVRHEERLRLRLDVAPETLHLPVPPMLLQTLVENAVKYGISQSPEGGEIAIIARRETGGLRLQVTNPGVLTTPAPKAATVSTGVGLRNAAERMRLLFGDSATLQLRALAPRVVMAEALIPTETLRPAPAA
ncbi:MAG TPA: histidine kinase [Opitutaceae bacterium]|nr:histidine kinase [Opitutaceae bacterium]HRJ46093.1 histidine kinase [Opitutaceae bacterium]